MNKKTRQDLPLLILLMLAESKKLNIEDQSEMLSNFKRLFREVKAGSWRLGSLFPGKTCLLWRRRNFLQEN